MIVGWGGALGEREKNKSLLFLERASAIVLLMPGMCVEEMRISYFAQKNANSGGGA